MDPIRKEDNRAPVRFAASLTSYLFSQQLVGEKDEILFHGLLLALCVSP